MLDSEKNSTFEKEHNEIKNEYEDTHIYFNKLILTFS